jgi:hypothetical protein
MKFLDLHLLHKEFEFGNKQGYDDIKNPVRRALTSDEIYNLLFAGPSASVKTLFLLGILECRKGVFFDGSNTTSPDSRCPRRVICIDEMCHQFQFLVRN